MRSRWAVAPAREVIGQFPASCARVAKCRARAGGSTRALVACPRDLACIRAWHSRAVAGNGHTTSGGTHRCKVLTVVQPKQRPQRSPITLSNRTVNRPYRGASPRRPPTEPNRSCQPSHAHGPCPRRCIISHCTRLEGRGYERFARVPSCSSARSSAPASFSTRMIVKYPRMHASM